MKKVIVIVGPTASGKTKNSIKVAKAVNGEVINGDSVQVYKELNIGSAKIKDDEKEDIKHHLFDVVSVGTEYSAYNFQQDARSLIDQIDTPIIVGGTGFYIKSALYNYEFEKRDDNDFELDKYSNAELFEMIKEFDPKIDLDQNNRRRLISAYKQALSGTLRSEKTGKDEPLYDVYTIYLDLDRTYLKKQLIKRLDIMLESGFVEEVEMLRLKNTKLNVIGYRELNNYLEDMTTLEEAKALIIKASMSLAKRQKTWFKNQMNVKVYDALANDTTDEIIKDIKDFLNNNEVL